jgi:RNA polymerase sigma-70 factor, ECF subfamily
VQIIIREILSGNTEAFRNIIREHNEDLLRIAYHFVHDWDEAQDITQSTFIACYRHLKKYDPQRQFRPWLYRIHLNHCKTAARRWLRRSKQRASLEEAESLSPHEFSSGDERIILRQIQQLSPKQKAAFIMVEIENLNSKEAAECLGCSDSTLRVHLARAKQNLRTRLKQLGFDNE